MHERLQKLLGAGMAENAEAGLLPDCMWSMHGRMLAGLPLATQSSHLDTRRGPCMLLPQPQLGADLEKCQREEAGRANAKVWVY